MQNGAHIVELWGKLGTKRLLLTSLELSDTWMVLKTAIASSQTTFLEMILNLTDSTNVVVK